MTDKARNNKIIEENKKMMDLLENMIKSKDLDRLDSEVIDKVMEELSSRLNLVQADFYQTFFVFTKLSSIFSKQLVEFTNKLQATLDKTSEDYKKFNYLKSKKAIKLKNTGLVWENKHDRENIISIASTGMGYVLRKCSECKERLVVWLQIVYQVKYSDEFYCINCWPKKIKRIKQNALCPILKENISIIEKELLENMLIFDLAKLEK